MTETTTKKKTEKPVKNSVSSEEFAVIETGGKQYVVFVGDVVDVELLGEHKEGDKIEFNKVLMTDNGKDTTIGMPYIDGAKVIASYMGLEKGEKLSIVRFKAKSNRHRKIGHRQKYSRVRIETLK